MQVIGPTSSIKASRLKEIVRRTWFRACDFLGSNPPDLAPLEAQVGMRTGPIRVGFLVCSPAKWSAQALFDALSADPDFDPFFCVTVSDAALHSARNTRQQEFSATQAFFAQIGRVQKTLYDTGRDRMGSVAHLDVDVLFIQQPWGMQDVPRQLAGTCLCAYLHYGFPVIRNDRMQFGLRHFHPYLWCHIVPDAVHADMMQAAQDAQAHHVVVAGYPKLDVYLDAAPARTAVTEWPHATDADRPRVIYAPHHSLDPASLALATFEWSGPEMLALAQDNPQIDFMLKPHPNLALEAARAGPRLRKIYDDFMAGWHAAENCGVFLGGGYFDIFRTSDLMITDSGSFLAEYLPTGRPLLRLLRTGSAPLNAAGEGLAHCIYTASDAVNLHAQFQSLVLVGEDALDEVRRVYAADLTPSQSSGDRALAHLRGQLPNLADQ